MFSFLKVPVPGKMANGQAPVLQKPYSEIQLWQIFLWHTVPAVATEFHSGKNEHGYDLAVEEAQRCVQGIHG